MSTVHAPDEKLVHSCGTCGRKFPHLFRLRMHEKTHLAYDKVRLDPRKLEMGLTEALQSDLI